MPTDLTRFVTAQDNGGTYAAALTELRAGQKHSHWMWFVFPQLAGLGRSATARRYAVAGLAEASDYLAHPVLGPRLVECAEALCALPATDPVHVFGQVDALKLRSSMTLFERALGLEKDTQQEARQGTGRDAGQQTSPSSAFRSVLAQYFDGIEDPETVRLLGV